MNPFIFDRPIISIIQKLPGSHCYASTQKCDQKQGFRRFLIKNCVYNVIKEIYDKYVNAELRRTHGNSHSLRIIVNVKTAQSTTAFLKDLHYSYAYRKQINLKVPENLDLYKKPHLYYFLHFLLNEYFEDPDKGYNNSFLINPIYFHKYHFCTQCQTEATKLENIIVVIPYL